jgi:hypothetical protein
MRFYIITPRLLVPTCIIIMLCVHYLRLGNISPGHKRYALKACSNKFALRDNISFITSSCHLRHAGRVLLLFLPIHVRTELSESVDESALRLQRPPNIGPLGHILHLSTDHVK